MNAHAIVATMMRQSETHPSIEEWVAHTAAVTLPLIGHDPTGVSLRYDCRIMLTQWYGECSLPSGESPVGSRWPVLQSP